MSFPIETKTISGKEVDIEVTSGPRGEIRKLKIYESGNSIAIFHEEYDELEEVDSPVADPGLPELLYPDQKNSGNNDSPFIRRSEKKPKLLVRLQLEDDEGIVSKHATFFPTKLKKKDSVHIDVDSDYYYDMSSFPRGTLTLLNVKNFRSSSGMAQYPRHGTDRDADGLCALFLELGFIVERYDNPTKKIMLSALEIAASDEKSSCCACAILTHGDQGIVYATDHAINIRDITKLFRKKCLSGKPKIFIFQACQGIDYSDGMDSADVKYEEKDLSLPCESDFFYAYSTVPGYFSWRNSRQGSWFIQAVCSVFRENAGTMDLYKMFTRVNDRISLRKSSTDDISTDDRRQIASIVSQMRKDLYFFPPYGPLPLIKSFASYK